MEIDTGNMCSHLKRKLFEEEGPYHKIWLALQADSELTAIIRSRQLHIYRNGKNLTFKTLGLDLDQMAAMLRLISGYRDFCNGWGVRPSSSAFFSISWKACS